VTGPILVCGAGGFVAQHLIEHLLDQGDEPIAALGRRAERPSTLPAGVEYVQADLGDAVATAAVIAKIRPGAVYQLAAQSSVADSLVDPLGTITNNVALQVNLLSALVDLGTQPRVLVIGSSEQYGLVRRDERPLPETTEFRPLNPYAVSKITQDLLGYQYCRTHRLPVIRARPFTHIGPGQAPRFVTPSFARQIARIETGLQPAVLKVGNLTAERDITDVRDIVRGYRLLLRQGEPGEAYNLGSERLVTIQQMLDQLLALSRVDIQVERDPARLRPADAPPQVADCRKVQAQTGWRAEIPLVESLRDVLDAWRARVAELGERA
jgi:GDP-4-dehydro-6-deoxy-D-mannose reductase